MHFSQLGEILSMVGGPRNAARSIGNALVVVILLTLINKGWTVLFDRPLIYCWFSNSELTQLFSPFYSLTLIVLAVMAAIMVTKNAGQGAGLIVVFFLVAGIPGYFEILFNTGGSCGG